MNRFVTRRGAGQPRAVVAALGLFAVLALVGAASVGQAASGTSVVAGVSLLTQAPTPGGNIFFTVSVDNNSPNAVNHLTITDTLGGDKVVYLSDTVNCTGVGTNTATCTQAQMVSQGHFQFDVGFSTSSNEASVTNTPGGTFDPQTPTGTTNHRNDKTDTIQTTPMGFGLTSNQSNTFARSRALVNDGPAQGLKAGVTQTGTVTMPAAFDHSRVFTDTTIQETSVGGLTCGAPPNDYPCLPHQIQISIPDSLGGSDPFSVTLPFKWTLDLPGTAVNSSFKVHGVYHDQNLIPSCSVQPLSTTVSVCYTVLQQDKHTGAIHSEGIAYINGSYGYG
jgi:uncharacterized repeat protein (TIGR01451 family)